MREVTYLLWKWSYGLLKTHESHSGHFFIKVTGLMLSNKWIKGDVVHWLFHAWLPSLQSWEVLESSTMWVQEGTTPCEYLPPQQSIPWFNFKQSYSLLKYLKKLCERLLIPSANYFYHNHRWGCAIICMYLCECPQSSPAGDHHTDSVHLLQSEGHPQGSKHVTAATTPQRGQPMRCQLGAPGRQKLIQRLNRTHEVSVW